MLTEASVLKACLDHKQKTGTWPTAESTEPPELLTKDQVDAAVTAYHKEYGKYPGVSSGDATKWLGSNISWASVAERLGKLTPG